MRSWPSCLKPINAADFFSSFSVFLVALPLCIGIAIAQDMPPAAGILTGIIGGIAVGALTGSPLQVSGPAAGLVVVVLEIVNRCGLEGYPFVLMAAGIIQIAAGKAKFGQWFRAFSPAVIYGMLSGIGIIILAGQIHVMLDHKPHGSALDNILAIPHALIRCFDFHDGHAEHLAGLVGLITILVLVTWRNLPIQKVAERLPPSPFAVLLATIFTYFLGLEVKTVSIPDSLLNAIQFPASQLPKDISPLLIFGDGLLLAAIASAQTLITATAIDKMKPGHKTDYDKELFAQGVGNTICGLIGALPMAGVIVRSSVNVQSGATSRLSAILHGVWLILFTVAFPGLLRLIPVASLAAILVYTGYRLVNVRIIERLRTYGGNAEIAIYVATIVAIVTSDLLTGVLLGFVLSVFRLVFIFSNLKVRKEVNDGKTILYLSGAATFLTLPKLATVLDSVEQDTELHVQLEELSYVDHACLELFMDWEKQYKGNGGQLVLDWGALEAKFMRPLAKDHDKKKPSPAPGPINASLDR